MMLPSWDDFLTASDAPAPSSDTAAKRRRLVQASSTDDSTSNHNENNVPSYQKVRVNVVNNKSSPSTSLLQLSASMLDMDNDSFSSKNGGRKRHTRTRSEGVPLPTSWTTSRGPPIRPRAYSMQDENDDTASSPSKKNITVHKRPQQVYEHTQEDATFATFTAAPTSTFGASESYNILRDLAPEALMEELDDGADATAQQQANDETNIPAEALGMDLEGRVASALHLPQLEQKKASDVQRVVPRKRSPKAR